MPQDNVIRQKLSFAQPLVGFVSSARDFADRWLIAWFFKTIFRTPNKVSIYGAIIFTIGCVVWSLQRYYPPLQFWGIGIAVFGGLGDYGDGAVARRYKMKTKRGRVLDTALDRMVDAAAPITVFIYSPSLLTGIVSGVAVGGSNSVSLVNQLAKLVNADAKPADPKADKPKVSEDVGLGQRVVRLGILGIAALVGYPVIGLWVVAILSVQTYIQRVWTLFVEMGEEADE